ncbi:MAG TPA: T9SS type A sorting domain-containing protein [Flavipsychrobacter sp.]|nr:T9SS type A sorting domain-containing protein [Flavipsychrobacter sp.]
MKRSLLFAILFLSFISARAQLTSNYPTSNALVVQGTYTDLGSSGTVITTASTDDAVSAAQSIGFSFNYNGASYTDFIFCTNGFIKLGTTAPSTSNLFYANPQTGTPTTSGGLFNSTNVADVNFISPLCLDLIGATGVEYRVHTTGSVGSRVCTIQWKNVADKNTPIATQYATMEFQIKLYETSNIIEFIYGTATASTNNSAFKAAIAGLKGSSNAANQLISITKGSTQAWNLATFLAGNYTGNSFNFGNNVVTNRPLPTAGVTYRFIPVYPNDNAVLAIYTLGKLPKQYVTPQYIRARIKNSGTNTQSNFKVYLTVRGVNTFDDSVTITSLAPNTESTISFVGYTSFNNGLDTVRVFVIPDDNNFNNDKMNTQLVNDDVYSYADPNIPAAGGIGFTGATGQFCAKFPYSGIPNTINQVGVNFFAGGVPLQIGIWDKNATTGGPGTLLWSSAQFTSVTGLNTIPVNPAVSISDTFFVGVLQGTTNNASFAFQAEVPVRNLTFYYGALNSTVWSDFSTAGSNFRFMVEPRFQSPNDVGVTSIDYPCQIVPLGQGSLYPFSTVFNYGLLPQTNLLVSSAIYLNNIQVYSSSTTVASIASGASQQVNFPTLFSPTSAGTYVIKSWTALPGDAAGGNDTASSTLQIVDYSAITNGGLRLQFDGIDDHITVVNTPILNPGLAFTIEGWFGPGSLGAVRTLVSKDSTATTLSYNLSLNATGNVTFTVQTTAGTVTTTSSNALSVGTWYHIAATYDGVDMKIYVNGALVGSSAQTGFVVNNNSQLFIGRTGGTTPLYFSGGMEEVRIWTSPRTATEIRQGMHKSITPFSDPNLVSYLRFDEGVGSFYSADASGNCNHGTLVNMDLVNAWSTSPIPLGTPVVATQTVSGSGPVTFTNAHLNMNFSGYTGSEDYFVHMFNAAPIGTQPSASPGGITAVHPRTWIVYQYGSATYTNADATFELINNTLLPTAVNSDVKLFNRSNGSAFGWTLTQNSATALNITPPTATYSFTSATQLNQQFVIGGNNNPLPIKLISFDATANGKDAQLNWQTSSEENTEKFVIERSTDGIAFEKVGELKGKGNHYDLNNYSFIDRNVGFSNTKVQYRLRMIEFDGRVNFSNVRTVRFGAENIIISVQPNPFREKLTVTYNATTEETITINISDLQGKIISQQSMKVLPGINELTALPPANLTNGMYLLSVTGGQHSLTRKIVKE